MRKTVIVYVLLVLSSCSLIFSDDFLHLGSSLKKFPPHLEGDWIRADVATSSFIERILVKKSSFLIEFSGSDSGEANEIALSDSVRMSYREPFYLVQVATEKGILISIFTCSGDTMRVFEPNLQEMETAFGRQKQSGNFGIPLIRIDEQSMENALDQPGKYLVRGDFFVKQKKRSAKKRK